MMLVVVMASLLQVGTRYFMEGFWKGHGINQRSKERSHDKGNQKQELHCSKKGKVRGYCSRTEKGVAVVDGNVREPSSFKEVCDEKNKTWQGAAFLTNLFIYAGLILFSHSVQAIYSVRHPSFFSIHWSGALPTLQHNTHNTKSILHPKQDKKSSGTCRYCSVTHMTHSAAFYYYERSDEAIPIVTLHYQRPQLDACCCSMWREWMEMFSYPPSPLTMDKRERLYHHMDNDGKCLGSLNKLNGNGNKGLANLPRISQ